MTYYNEQLQQLQEQVAQKNRAEAKLKELKAQCGNLDSQVQELKQVMWDEQTDVDRLERTSLSSIFYTLLGKKNDMLDKEKMEAYAAKVKYDAAEQELSLVKEDIRRIEAQIRKLSGCEQRYESVLHEKAAAIKAGGSPDGERLLQLELQIGQLKNQKKEIGEAVTAGTLALRTTDNILSSLSSAHGWGTWDLLGGGLVSDIAKHSHLDEAQSMVAQLQRQLRLFKTELADVTIQADMQVNIDGFLRFADYFFDGLFADWAVMDKISQSQSSVENTRRKIQKVLSQLKSMDAASEREIAKLQRERDAIVVRAEL